MARRLRIIGVMATVVAVLASIVLVLAGCDKERIVESTEYVHDIEYIQLPPDTITVRDTVFAGDTVTIHDTDTILQPYPVHDTVRVTVTVYDTVETIRTVYDTVNTIDTVIKAECSPNALLAVAALQYHTDPLVLEMVNAEFGMSDGWIFYLSPFQMDFAAPSAGVYDFAGYIDYWTTDWSGYYPIEFYWRVSFIGGDPVNPENWQLSDPPSAAGKTVGLRTVSRPAVTSQLLK